MSDDKTRTRAAAGDTTAGGDGYATTEPGTENTTGEATIVPTWGVTSIVALPDPGYQLGELIGRGGMGEVVVAQDQRVGREVAVKRIRSKSPTHDAVQRFLREARIQARLDHPAIVPVYELGTDADGRPYFTMKRLTGVTLAKRLADHGPIQPLLRAFVDVCLAIQLAHSRGVVHRDLKPSNIMLGDYGEVYVIDWGVARVIGDRTRVTHPMAAIEDAPDDEQTTAGAILGTPGYMPPEQIRGAEVGAAADVYALGAILFEILAGEPLHPRGEAALATTLTEPQVAPATRALERTIAPELDSVCFDALAEEPKARPSARELADRIQAYLDGDRDLERRRTLAAEQLASAQDALDSDKPDARATAMRRAGRALALDPDSPAAAALVTQLMVEPPAKLPADLVASLAADERVTNRDRAKQAMWAYILIFAFVPLVPFLDVKSWPLQLAFWGLTALIATLAYTVYRTGKPRVASALVANLAFIVVFSRLAGPFMLTPIVTVGILLSFTANPGLIERRWLIFVWGAAAVALPLVLEATGAMPHTFEVVDGTIRTTSDFYRLKGPVEEVALVIANAGFIGIASFYALAISRYREAARRTLHVQAWHLRQLLPNQRPWRTRP
jgi:serine/threonine-protein kinase